MAEKVFVGIQIVLTALALWAYVLCMRNHSACWVLWLVTDLGWFVVNCFLGVWVEAGLFLAYFLLTAVRVQKLIVDRDRDDGNGECQRGDKINGTPKR